MAYKDGYSLPGPLSPDCQASPMSELAHCFTGLSAFHAGDTPRRCLDLSNISTDSPDVDATQISPHQDKPGSVPVNYESPVLRNNRMKKVLSFLPRLLCSSPKVLPCETSCHDKENEPPAQRVQFQLGDFLSAQDSQFQGDSEPDGLESPPFCLPPFSLSNNCPRGADVGGFMEILEQDFEQSSVTSSMSCSMAQLLSEPIMNQEVNLSSVSVCHQEGRRLFRSPSMPGRLERLAGKRACSSPAVAGRPLKRHCTFSAISEEASEREGDQEPGVSSQRRLRLKKTHSLCEGTEPLGGDWVDAELIGDSSKMYALPTVPGRHQELKYITGETMRALLEGKFSCLVESFVVVDCRYPYEYQGGHIKGAMSLPNTVEAVQYLLSQKLKARSPHKRFILVLHCEFSSERGPRTCRLLRREDRSVNEYPALHYPELYILKGGYRDFYHSHQEHCEPQAYCPMHHQDHREELLRCRTHGRAAVEEHRRRQHIHRLIKPLHQAAPSDHCPSHPVRETPGTHGDLEMGGHH
ncbi:M-phase inducer phosphatase 1-A-like [Osmerus mordax]|uniref:M-phase inducer phosphatase 1-A-like n=1 Tax=Osmerus mordax TaxID=8014 RepID=UPI00350EFA1D